MVSTIAVVVIVLVAAWGADRWRRRRIWGSKSTEELLVILSGPEWRKWELALEELRRRGYDASGAVAALARRFSSESKWERATARIVLMNIYPDTRAFLKDYRETLRFPGGAPWPNT
jgi:hypothetical protein